MKYRKILSTLALGSLLSIATTASAEWKVVSDLGSSPFSFELFDTENCNFRYRYVDKQHAERYNQYSDHYFNVNSITQFRKDSENGNVYSQSLEASIDSTPLSRFNFGGALSADQYSKISNLYKSPKNPWDLKIQYLHSQNQYQFGLAYKFVNPDTGSTYVTSVRLDPKNFTLEAQCVESAVRSLTSVTASAYGTYYEQYFGPQNTLDGDQNTYWITDANTESPSITFNFGKSTKLTSANFTWYNKEYSPGAFLIETSIDGSKFVSVETGYGNQEKFEFDDIDAKFLRLTITKASGYGMSVLREATFEGK